MKSTYTFDFKCKRQIIPTDTTIGYYTYLVLCLLTLGFFSLINDTYTSDFVNDDKLDSILEKIFTDINPNIAKNAKNRSFLCDYINYLKLNNLGFDIVITTNKYDKYIEITRYGKIKCSRTFYL